MRFLVIDDHPMMRDAITAALHSVDPGFTVHGASTLAEGFRTIDASDPFDLLFLDLGLPGMQGLQSLEEVRLRHPALPVVVVSGSGSAHDAIAAIDQGAMGFIPKTAERDVFLGAFQLVARGGVYVPPEVLTVLAPLPAAGRRPGGATEAPGAQPAGARAPAAAAPPAASGPAGAAPAGGALAGLTERQREVLALLVRGLPNKLIARRLDISESTVKLHVSGIFQHLGVRNRTHALVEASRLGLEV
jgi:DNA-binding NarL/FixJ family response regulator